jgi:hypothetical protein
MTCKGFGKKYSWPHTKCYPCNVPRVTEKYHYLSQDSQSQTKIWSPNPNLFLYTGLAPTFLSHWNLLSHSLQCGKIGMGNEQTGIMFSAPVIKVDSLTTSNTATVYHYRLAINRQWNYTSQIFEKCKSIYSNPWTLIHPLTQIFNGNQFLLTFTLATFQHNAKM